MLMRKWILLLLVFSFLLCSCSRKESDTSLEFPGTSWGMDMREVQDALDLDEKDIGYTYVSDVCISSMFHTEDYELFGAKTKSIDFQFLDLDHIRQKKEEQKDDPKGHYDQWKFYEKAIDRAGWDTFSKNAYMQSVLCLNEKDRKSLLCFGFHAGIYRTLQE